MSNNRTVKKILILAANPKNTVRLRLDQEVRDIEEGLQLARQRDNFILQQKGAVRPRDIRLAVLDFRPNIIHFSGHGSQTEGLSFEDEVGKEKFVTAVALAEFFKLFANDVECVLLNACYSEVQASAIAQHIDYVIGMNQAIADKAALEFSVGFYDALARYEEQYDGDSPIEFAFDVACNAILMAGVTGASIPVLIKNPNARKRNERGDNQLLGQLIGDVPNLPPHFLPREEQLKPLKHKVLAHTNQAVAITEKNHHLGLLGMGGIGKTVLATALALDEEVRRAFPDGVIWITFGQTPQILTWQSYIAQELGDNQAAFTEISLAKARLRELLTGKACLLILDDVWNLEHASAFDVLEKPCQMLITTRDAGIITALGGEEYQLSILSEEQALALLADWANQAVETLAPTAQDVARECGYLPLALSLNGAMVKDGTPWGDLLKALRGADLEFFDHPHGSILKSIKISIDALNQDERQHYLELAVFPEDTAVPEATILQLWTRSNQLEDYNARKLLTTLARKALLPTTGKAPQRKVKLHDLQYDYLQRAVSNLSELHNQFLNAYTQKYPNGWHSLDNDGYIFLSLAHHLIQAGRTDDLQQLLLDFRWLQAKLENSNINELIADYNLLPKDANLQLLQQTLVLSRHVLAEDKRQLAGQLWGRLQCFAVPEIQQLLQQAKQNKTTWLRPVTSSLTRPDGNLIRTLTGHSSWVYAIALSPDGKYLISASSDDTLKVWDWQTGEKVRTLTGHSSSVYAIAFSVDGKYLISGSSDDTLKVWDWQTGEKVRTLTGHNKSVLAIAFSADGKYLISGSSDDTLKVWDWQTGEKVRTLTGHTDSILAIAFSVDGKYLISGSRDSRVKVWDWQTGEKVRTLSGHSSGVLAIAFSVDGKYLISASSDNTLKVWDWQTGEKVRTLTGHSDSVLAIALSPDGKYLISASSDKTLKVWDWQTGEKVRTLTGHNDSVLKITFSVDGKYLISSSWDNTLKVWDWQTGEKVGTLTGHSDSVLAIAFSADGKYLISGSWDNTLKVWDWQTGEKVGTIPGHNHSVLKIAFSVDGKYLISGSSDDILKVWDWQTGEEVRTIPGHSETVLAIAFSVDGKYLISGSSDTTLKVWHWQNGEKVRTLTGHSSDILAIAFSPDGKYLVSSSHHSTLKVWDWQTGEEVRTLTGHTDSVNAIAFSHDGKYLVSGSLDTTLKVWDWQTGEVIATFTGESAIKCCAFTGDCLTIVAGEASGRVHFLQLEGV
jgi:WD40 repeat protein